MTKWKSPIYSAHISADNVLLCVRAQDGDFISDANFSPKQAKELGQMLLRSAKNARKMSE